MAQRQTYHRKRVDCRGSTCSPVQAYPCRLTHTCKAGCLLGSLLRHQPPHHTDQCWAPRWTSRSQASWKGTFHVSRRL